MEVQRGRYILKILNPVDNQILPGNPLVLLDGVPLFDPDLLMAIDPRRLLRIDVVASRYVVGDQSFGGIISVRTRRGDHSEIPFGSARQVGFKAFQPVKPCIRPDYETADRIHDRIPDFRTVLYWDPVVRTDGSGQAVVEFYTSDESDSYTITVQGITESGDPVHLEQVIEVTGK